MKCILHNLKFHLVRPQAFRAFRDLRKSQYWNTEQWEAHHQYKQRELVHYAFENVPFYRDYYRSSGFVLGDMDQEGWFERLPILTKEQIRNNFDQMTNPDILRHAGISTTGGSTGVPLKVRYDKRIPYEAYAWRFLEWWGCHPWEDAAYVWRNPRNKRQQLLNDVIWWPTRRIKLDASVMTEQGMREFIRRFNRISPTLLQGYVGAINELASFVLKAGISVAPPKMVWVTSAPVSAVQRNRIEQAFSAPVCDQYGSCEIPHLAVQCPARQGLHVNSEHVFMEFADDSDKRVTDSEWGKTLLTNYDEFSFPLIRYENGDRGRWLNERCSCGRTLPLIDSVKGRVAEMVYLPSGRMINGEYLTTLFDAFPDVVAGFRVVQKKDLSLLVEYVPAAIDGKAALRRVKETLDVRVQGEVPVSLKAVQDISHDRGKLRFIVREK